MCGRYVLSLPPSYIRSRLVSQNLPVDDAPRDDEQQTTYNFAPGGRGVIYRPITRSPHDGEPSPKKAKLEKKTSYHLQSARWGLIPHWTKQPPEYRSMMKTINCRDDSLMENRGMWTAMKRKQRCVVIAEGFYEWMLKGSTKVPYYVKRKDGGLMFFAGLWDCVRYEGKEEVVVSYTVITTESNAQLRFLHERMPVILEANSEGMGIWLDPERVGWDEELQGVLKPFEGKLECYPVDPAVGKVGNDSPRFVMPVNSRENKGNIANFFPKGENKRDGDVKEAKSAKQSVDENAKEAEDTTESPTSDGKTFDAADAKPKIKHEEEGAHGNTTADIKPAAILKTPTKQPITTSKSASKTPSKKRVKSPAKTPKGNQSITNFFTKKNS